MINLWNAYWHWLGTLNGWLAFVIAWCTICGIAVLAGFIIYGILIICCPCLHDCCDRNFENRSYVVIDDGLTDEQKYYASRANAPRRWYSSERYYPPHVQSRY